MITEKEVSARIYSAVDKLAKKEGKEGRIILTCHDGGKKLVFTAIFHDGTKQELEASKVFDLGFDPLNMISNMVKSKLLENIQRISLEKEVKIGFFSLLFFNQGDTAKAKILSEKLNETHDVIDLIKI